MAPGKIVQQFISLYGDLIFDFCHSVLRNPIHSQNTFRHIFKKLLSQRRKLISRYRQSYSHFERSWVLQIVCSQLLKTSEQLAVRSDSNSEPVNHFDLHFRRLPIEDQMLLLLKDKYRIPYDEISTSMNIAEGSLKIKRQQALRTLEQWIQEWPPA